MEAVISHTDEHKELLTQLGELDYAPAALEQAQAHLKELEARVAPHHAALKRLEAHTRSQYDDWQKIQKSMLRRAALRVKGGKEELEERVEKEEKEWLDALREVRRGRLRQRVMALMRDGQRRG